MTKVNTTAWPMIGRSLNIASIPAVANGLVKQPHAAYGASHKKLINPGSIPSSVFYAASGQDLAMPLITFDPVEAICIDKKKVNPRKLHEAVIRQRLPLDPSSLEIFRAIIDRRDCDYWKSEHFRRFSEELIAYELMMLGVKKHDVRISEMGNGDVEVRFPWAYPGRSAVERSFRYVSADVTVPEWYSPWLKDLLRRGVDYFYQKCAVECLGHAERYLPVISRSVRNAMLISPVTSGELHAHNSLRLMKILGRDFYYDDRVNRLYDRVFQRVYPGTHHLRSYRWLIELWRRKGT